uniref:Uncharacterized protein n=1 Tax=Aegilops tauschii subsp. strangulata TaxID=200361 RepID=A0A453HJN8_AEGTS|nr:uncharacterized protein LOC109735131 [Aegilops tauschii subsp. strangulata]
MASTSGKAKDGGIMEEQQRDATLPYEYDGLRFVADVVTRSIAWPSSKMKPYKPGHLPHPATKDAVRLCMEDKRNKKEP